TPPPMTITSSLIAISPVSSQDSERSIPPRRPHDSATRMRGGSAHPQIPNRRVVLRPARDRPREEQLLQRQLALKDVALCQSEIALEIQRRENLTMPNDVANIRRVLRNRVDDRVAERFAPLVPRARRERVRRVLHETR